MQKIKPQRIFFDLIYEDKYIIVINKKPNIIVHTNNKIKKNTIINGLIDYIENSYYIPRSGIIHRLDKNTTGIMVIAKSNEAQKNIMMQFRKKLVCKFYSALIHGSLLSGGTIRNKIIRDNKNVLKMTLDKDHKNNENAITHYRIAKKYKKYTLLNVKIETGKTHQIRLHFSNLGFPIVGDKTYNRRINTMSDIQVDYQLLHAKCLKFFHPITKKELCFFSKLPSIFNRFLKYAN